MKRLWQLSETELLSGRLTMARCPRCGGSGSYRQTVLSYDDDLQERETEQIVTCDCPRRPAELLARANLPAVRFGGLTLADLDWDAIRPSEAVTGIRDYAEHLEEWLEEGMGLVLYGAVGTGKTHLAVGLCKLACGLGIEALFLTMSQLLNRLKATYNNQGNGSKQEIEVLNELTNVSLLVLDDLGAENPSAWARDRIYDLVNRRYLAGRPLIVTTNHGPQALAEALSERAVSRLWGTSLRVRLQGNDYRERIRRQKLRRVRSRRKVKA